VFGAWRCSPRSRCFSPKRCADQGIGALVGDGSGNADLLSELSTDSQVGRHLMMGEVDKVGRVCYHYDSRVPDRQRNGRGTAMADLLVRDLNRDTVDRLKQRARSHGRSLQGEVKAILEAASVYSLSEAGAMAEEWQRRLAGGTYSDSAEAIGADRER